MALNEEQRKYFFDNYLLIPLNDIAINLGISIKTMDYFILKTSVKTLRKKCKVFKNREKFKLEVYDKTVIENREIECFWYEPKFTSEELESYRESLTTPKRIKLQATSQEVNGKQCTVFQSRMNY